MARGDNKCGRHGRFANKNGQCVLCLDPTAPEALASPPVTVRNPATVAAAESAAAADRAERARALIAATVTAQKTVADTDGTDDIGDAAEQGSGPAPTLTIDDLPTVAAVAAATDRLGQALRDADADLALAVSEEGVESLRARMSPGVVVSARTISGNRYKQWNVPAAIDALAPSLAEEHEMDPAAVRSILNDYTTVRTVDYFRARALRDQNLHASDFAVSEPSPPTLALDGMPDATVDRDAALTCLRDGADTIAAAETIADNATDDILRTPKIGDQIGAYARLKHAHQALTGVVRHGLDALTPVVAARGTSITTADGTVASLAKTATKREWDVPAAHAAVIPKLSADHDADPTATENMIESFTSIAHATGFKTRGLTAMGLDPDAYSVTHPGTQRLRIAVPDRG